MKKYILLPLLIALIPNMVFGSTARYSKLLHEKQRKMEQLEKCMGASKGLKIAGLSTIGLTAVGVAGNIWEAKAIKDNKATIDKNEKKIGDLQKKIDEKGKQIKEKEIKEREKAERLELAQLECSKRGGEYDSGTKSCLCNEIKMKSNERCSNGTVSEIPLPVESPDEEGGLPINCTEEFLEQHNAATGVECGEEKEQLDTCCIKTCKPGYHTTLNGEDHPVNSNDDLDTELICEPIVNFVSATEQLVYKGKVEETPHIKTPEGMNVQPEIPTSFSRDIIYVQPNENAIETPHLQIKPVGIDNVEKDPEA